MAGKPTGNRPLSPHIGTYKWGPHMAVSILHRISGDALAIAGAGLFLWWLAAIAGGEQSYAAFVKCVWHDPDATLFHQITNVLGKIVLVGLTWAFFQHLFSGLRHLVLDTGAGYELKTNRLWSLVVIVAALFATGAFWLRIMAGAF